ncbi:MAG TPA: UDP-N-acetylmuramoyl-L-alanine--D-glutamate ligase [Acidimicrobiales bacterium]|nr:UDP-N-acetylmuramoyl-L-alanine--D-glutamate ligase [Acidimicrobiales bacterium]
MFRPTGFADLAGRRVGIFGFGVEGRAAAALLREQCELVIVDDVEGLDDEVLVTTRGGMEALRSCEVVLKSPGIPRRREDVLDLEQGGVTVTSALNLWLHDTDLSRVIAVTGTKGKSTTTSLITFFLRCVNQPAQRLGNIGQPPYDPSIDTSSGWLVLEVSSYQVVDLDLAPRVVVVTSLGEDHIDWHGSLEQYRSDKLSLTRAVGPHRTYVADSATLRQHKEEIGGELIYVKSDESNLATTLGLIGKHNNSNVALALAAVHSVTGITDSALRIAIEAHVNEFQPLQGRLTLVARETSNGSTVRYIDDGLATAVLPTIAALEVFRDEPVALIAGGFDRGVDYEELADALSARVPFTSLVTIGNAGLRIGAAVHQRSPHLTQRTASTMREAVEFARTSLGAGGVVLLSPAAPSFDLYHNWEERSADFTRIVRSLLPPEPTS